MPNNKDAKRPLIVIRKKAAHAGHHGGAWKVAYADFVTAMMSLFIVLWLMSTSDQVKKSIAGYFNDPKGSSVQVGSAAINSAASEIVSIDRDNVEKLKQQIQKAILKQADLTKLSKQIEMTVTGEGLRIDLIEGSGGTFFESGSPKLSSSGVQLLDLLAGQLKSLPNQLLIEGHTDAQPFSSSNGYTNWELSADRANAARRLLETGGIRPGQVSQVRGFADQNLRVPSNPLDPSNRRVSLIVQWVDASSPAAQSSTQSAAAGGASAPGADTANSANSSASTDGKSADAKPAAAGKSADPKSTDAKPAAAGAAPDSSAPGTQSTAGKSADSKSSNNKSADTNPGAPASNAPNSASSKPSAAPGTPAGQPSAPASTPTASTPPSSKPQPTAPPSKSAAVFARLKSLIPGKKN